MNIVDRLDALSQRYGDTFELLVGTVLGVCAVVGVSALIIVNVLRAAL